MTDRPLDSYRHGDKRTNIPTEELRGFVADDEQQPPALLYPRNPDLDPQLVWQGKDEQDSHPLEVPVVPIYIQEKVHPQAIIEDIRRELRDGDTSEQLALFADFNGIDFADQIEFYQHQQSWANRMILGDSLLVINSLAEKEGLRGQVQMIYLDPPYGISFRSNWQVSTRNVQVQDGKQEHATRQPEQVRAFRDTWRLGVHSYLAYIRDRLVLARELLSQSGSIFVQIGDENVHRVRCLLDEVFGAENCCGEIVFAKTSGLGANLLADRFDFLLWYARDIGDVKYRQLHLEKSAEAGTAANYGWVELPTGVRRGMTREEQRNTPELPEGARIYKPDNITSQGNPLVEFEYRGRLYRQQWKTNPSGLGRLAVAGRLHVAANSLQYVRYLTDFGQLPVTKLWDDTATGSFTDPKVYVVQTGTKAIARCLLMTTDPGDLVLDPTCGSGTTAYVAEQWGRRWITIDTSRVALALARTRLMSAKHPYYLLADSPEGQAVGAQFIAPVAGGQIASVAGILPVAGGQAGASPCGGQAGVSPAGGQAGVSPAGGQAGAMNRAPTRDIRQGFAYRRVPHIKLSDISRNEEIDAIHARWQERLEPLRAEINQLAGQSWEEWEVPRPAEAEALPQLARQRIREWWDLRQDRQRAIDESIARHSEQEILYDQPYEDPKILRVTGPFTVESLSPHRILSTDEERPESEGEAARSGSVRFETMILDNLRKAGVQNTVRDERLVFDRLEPYAGTWIHADGEYTDKDEHARRVAVHLGPEHGTVGPNDLREAAKEAVQGIGFDVLVVCGFAFDSHVYEEAKRYPRPQIMVCKMNPDLAMGDELLKKTGAGNLFMVFGEPDIELRHRADGDIEVEIHGLDVYDPTTGQIRNSSTDDIACWFIDTAYNGEAFFVRHAYFTGGDEPYEQLARALRAEINEEAWSAIYATVSRPFPAPATGKIAVKVINHYGDEVLKVYEVG